MSLLKNNFLTREVKEDKNGPFVHYGGYRLRPYVKTSFVKSQLVSMTMAFEGEFDRLPAMKVFADINRYELWISNSIGKGFIIGNYIYTNRTFKK